MNSVDDNARMMGAEKIALRCGSGCFSTDFVVVVDAPFGLASDQPSAGPQRSSKAMQVQATMLLLLRMLEHKPSMILILMLPFAVAVDQKRCCERCDVVVCCLIVCDCVSREPRHSILLLVLVGHATYFRTQRQKH